MFTSPQQRAARRLKALREERGLTQAEMADLMDLPHRQTLGSIEAGERTISADELASAAEALSVEVGVFTDPYRLVGEGEFSFRADVAPDVLVAFRERAGRWVATYRTLRDRAGVPRSHLGCKLELGPTSSYEEAQAAAEELRGAWGLGDAPAETLVAAIERELGARVLFVDAPDGVSGAAVHLPGLHTIVVNRREPSGRRNFDIAHELFHLLTWDAMAPEPVEPREVPSGKGKRVERLAENFAGALLMPEDVVGRLWADRHDLDLVDWLNATATSLGVTAVALKWRLVVLGKLSKVDAASLPDARLVANGEPEREHAIPPLFDREMIGRLRGAVEEGHLSLGRVAKLLGLTTSEFGDVCRAYGLPLSYEV
jgi:Zn-dependent peptidase ImmA (M78 family)/transcriptional regulator with XRE-family HTH domain